MCNSWLPLAGLPQNLVKPLLKSQELEEISIPSGWNPWSSARNNSEFTLTNLCRSLKSVSFIKINDPEMLKMILHEGNSYHGLRLEFDHSFKPSLLSPTLRLTIQDLSVLSSLSVSNYSIEDLIRDAEPVRFCCLVQLKIDHCTGVAKFLRCVSDKLRELVIIEHEISALTLFLNSSNAKLNVLSLSICLCDDVPQTWKELLDGVSRFKETLRWLSLNVAESTCSFNIWRKYAPFTQLQGLKLQFAADTASSGICVSINSLCYQQCIYS